MHTLKEVEFWYSKALDIPESDRYAFLEREIRDNAELLSAVFDLLQAQANDKSALTLLRDGIDAELQIEEAPVLERYQVIEEIGRGGMSMVYLGERTDGLFEHKVAIKLLRSGMNSTDLLQVFERERNVLARLKHPNITQIYDAGLTQKADPFFVMEYIDGIDLLSYLKTKALRLKEKLDLFIQLGNAVHFAHQQTIIHRDIKPSNILISKQGNVKLMDFGIAEFMEEDPSPDAEISKRMLTPEYASPEQIEGDNLDVRSDIYQLGMVLGKMVQETEDPEINAIRKKACQTDKALRYQSVLQFLEDIQKKLEKKPIAAYSKSISYRTRLYFRRNALQVGIGIAAALILFTTSVVYFINLNTARRIAEEKEFLATQSLEFLVTLFDQNDPSINQGNSTDIGLFLDAGEGKINSLEETQTKAAILSTLGRVNTSLGNFQKADTLFIQASEIYKSLENAEAIGKVRFNQGMLEAAQNNFTKAKKLVAQAIPAMESDIEKVKALVQLAELSRSTHLDSSIFYKNTALDLIKTSDEFSEKDRLLYTYDLAWIGYANLSKEKKDSVVILKRSLVDQLEAVDPSDFVLLAEKFENMANTYENALLYDSTIVFARKSLQLFQQVYDSSSIFLTPSLYQLAAALSWKASFDSSLFYLQKSLRIKQSYFGDLHHSQLQERKMMSIIYGNLGRYVEAEQLMRTNFEVSREKYGLYHKITGDNLFVLLSRLGSRQKYQESIELYPLLIKIDSATYGESSFSATSILNYGQALGEVGRKKEALSNMKKALKIYREKVGPDDFRCGMALFSIGKTLKSNQPQKALNYMDTAVSIIENGMAKNHPRVATYQQQYADLLAKENDYQRSNEYYVKAIENYEFNYAKKFPERLAQFEEEYSKSLQSQGLRDSAAHMLNRSKLNYKTAALQ